MSDWCGPMISSRLLKNGAFFPACAAYGCAAVFNMLKGSENENRTFRLSVVEKATEGLFQHPARPLCIALITALLGACASGPRELSETESERILVTIVQSESGLRTSGNPVRRFRRRASYAADAENSALNELAKTYGLRRYDGWPIDVLDVYCEVFVLPENTSASTMLDRLQRDPRVESAQLVQTFETLNHPNRTSSGEALDDIQYALASMRVPQAHQRSRGEGITIAVIDSWVDRKHPELIDRVVANHDFSNRRNQVDADIHGTAVSGVIAAADDGVGITGVAPAAEILSLRACWSDAERPGKEICDSFSLAQSLTRAIDDDVDVINLSLGGPEDSLLQRLVEKAVERDIVVVSAWSETRPFPTSVSGVLAVASQGDSESKSGVRAPGEDVLTTVPHHGFDFRSGHSIAAAHGTGVIALALSLAPDVDRKTLKAALEATSGDAGLNACGVLQYLADIAAVDLGGNRLTCESDADHKTGVGQVSHSVAGPTIGPMEPKIQ